MSKATNPLVSDETIDFLLWDVHGAGDLVSLAGCDGFDRGAVELLLGNVRRFARQTLFPTYRPMDADAPRFAGGRMKVHPVMRDLYGPMADLGLLKSSELPWMLNTVCSIYLMAGNAAAASFMGLTAGAAHLIEAFGTPELQARLMRPMHDGRWTGTMALTEPQAGSSLSDLTTRATPRPDGTYAISGGKIFISGADNDFAENTVHLTLARIDGAPAGTRGISLFAVPRLRPGAAGLEDNDVHVAGAIHKLGARGIPSCVLAFGERGDCVGWLVGEAGKGLPQMFQMMNEARILVGAGATATASVAYHEALAYAKERVQGRPPAERDATRPPVPIIAHADVRRMLLRQKAIVEGSLSLLVQVGKLADLAARAKDDRAQLLLDLLTPVAKAFPSEKGFEANALAIQVHGGYGYSSEYLVEALLRDQKLNTLHEGTTGIQSLDLLGRKVVARGGEAMRALDGEIRKTEHPALVAAWDVVAATTLELAGRGVRGDVDGMLRHSADYLDMFSTVVIAWQWVLMAAAAAAPGAFAEGKRSAAEYWLATELPRVPILARLCREDESYARMKAEWF